jgi:predicted PurR-regulated permease PerM
LFLLIYGPGLYDNFINLFPLIRDKRRAVLLVGRLRQELSRYIITVTIINAGLGLVTGAVLWTLGVEDAILWGALVALLNYAPYVGPFISICILGVAGLAQYGLVPAALLPATVFFSINLLESQFVTPTVLGQHMRLNPLILILWLLIWGWLWGPVGLLIAVPLLVCLKLVASHVQALNFLVDLIETRS